MSGSANEEFVAVTFLDHGNQPGQQLTMLWRNNLWWRWVAHGSASTNRRKLPLHVDRQRTIAIDYSLCKRESDSQHMRNLNKF